MGLALLAVIAENVGGGGRMQALAWGCTKRTGSVVCMCVEGTPHARQLPTTN